MATERTVLVRLRASVTDFQRGMLAARAAVQGLTKDINTSNDRTAWLAQSITALAPAVVTMGAAAVPVLSGLTLQLGAVAGAAGVAALAFNGIGDGLSALNDYQIKPTQENLVKLNEAFRKVGQDGVEFIQFLDKAGDRLSVLGMDARAGMFPGLTSGINDFMTLLPRLRPIVTDIATAMGELGAAAGEGLAGESFRDFFEWLDNRAGDILIELGLTLGNFLTGFLNLLTALDVVSSGFTGGLFKMSQAFSEWSQSLDSNRSFEQFLEYVEKAGPMVLDLLGTLVDFGVALAQAAAPVGDVMVPALTIMLDLFTAIVNTPIGPVLIAAAAAIGLFGRAVATMSLISGGTIGNLVKTSAAVTGVKTAVGAGIPTMRQFGLAAAGTMYSTQTLTTAMNSQSKAASSGAKAIAAAKTAVGQFGRTLSPVAAGVGLMALSMSDLDDKAGLANTTMLTMLGTLADGARGGAIGFFAGYLMDAAAANDQLVDSTEAAIAAIEAQDAVAAWAAKRALERDIIDMKDTDPKEALGQLMDMDFGKLFSEGPNIGNARNGMIGFTEAGQDALAAKRQLDGALADTDGWAAQQEAALAAQDAVDAFIQSFSRLNNLLANKQSLIDYNRALRELQDRLKDRRGAKDFFDLDTEEGSKDMEAFIGLVDTAISRAEDLREQGKRTAAQKMLATALNDIESLNLRGPVAREQIRKILAELERLNKQHAEPRIRLDVSGPMASINALEARLRAIRDEDVFINIRRIGATTLGPRDGIADGGTIAGPRYPYGDKVLAWLAPGEEVITNRHGEADRYRRDRDLGFIPRYDIGGTVGGGGPAGGGATFGRLDRSGLENALSGLELTIDVSARRIGRELDRFAEKVRENGGRWTAAMTAQADQLRASARQYELVTRRLADQSKILADLQASYDTMAADRAALEEGVAGQFKTSITGSGLAGAFKAVQGDIAGRTSMDAALANLRSLGLDPNGALYRELLLSNDVKTASQLAAGGANAVATLSAQYAERDRLNMEAARAQGELVFGPGMADLAAKIADQTARVERVEEAAARQRKELKDEIRAFRVEAKDVVPKKVGKEVGDAVNGAAKNGVLAGQGR